MFKNSEWKQSYSALVNLYDCFIVCVMPHCIALYYIIMTFECNAWMNSPFYCFYIVYYKYVYLYSSYPYIFTWPNSKIKEEDKLLMLKHDTYTMRMKCAINEQFNLPQLIISHNSIFTNVKKGERWVIEKFNFLQKG